MNDLAERLKNMTPLQRAVFALQETQARLEALEARQSEPIAIVGMACRFPGRVSDVAAFWRLLCDGVDAIEEVPSTRWNIEEYYDPDPTVPGKMNSRWGGFVERIDEFDNRFFGISESEATQIDPQQRMLLELAWEALEDAGIPPNQLRGAKIGVFVGIANSEYASELTGDLLGTSAHAAVGTSLCLAANRVSFTLGLHGPSLSLETACSSSLVAVHLACQSIRSGDCDGALVGGVNLLLSPIGTMNLSKAGFCAPDGRIRAFDAAASGYVRSEGGALVMLKPLSSALKNQDPIYAVIRGSAVNQSGTSNGLTAPSRAAQEQVVREAYARAKLSPGRVAYIETHGTGTRLGDVIEATALGNVLRQDRPAGSPCTLGALKTNIGHLETAAGVAGLMKTALALQHRQVPPNVHFKNPNPGIPFESLSLRVPRKLEPWPDQSLPTFAGVSAFGFGGSNAHVVLESPPIVSAEHAPGVTSGGPSLLVLSARTEAALDDLSRAYIRYLRDHPPGWRDICYTAARRREHHDCRLALLATSHEHAIELLESYSSGQPEQRVLQGRKPYGRHLKVAFLFGDRPEAWLQCASTLVERTDGLSAVFDEIDETFTDIAGRSLVTYLTNRNDRARPELANVALVAFQWGLATWWRRAGVAPDVVAGQGPGELAAAAVAGILTPTQALQFAAGRLVRNGSDGYSFERGRESTLPFLSTVDGRRHSGSDLDAGHWGLCSRRLTKIAAAAHALAEHRPDCFLEIGPPFLDQEDRRTISRGRQTAGFVAAVEAQSERHAELTTAVGTLFAAGADICGETLAPADGHCVRIPSYPWQRQRLWAPRGNRWAKGLSATGNGRPHVAGSLSPDLPEAERRRRPELTAPYVAPETPLEADLIQAWSEALQMDGVGVHDNFFELGGDSLQATVLLNRLQDHLGEAIPGHALFQVQSVHELVNYLREHCPGAVRRHYPDELLAFGESGHFSEIVPPEALARGADVRGATPSFSIPRLARDEEADDLLSRLDDLEIDEVEKLLGRSKTSGEVIHE